MEHFELVYCLIGLVFAIGAYPARARWGFAQESGVVPFVALGTMWAIVLPCGVAAAVYTWFQTQREVR